eukprot:3741093-Alexandrium_andersonii.AAC.1
MVGVEVAAAAVEAAPASRHEDDVEDFPHSSVSCPRVAPKVSPGQPRRRKTNPTVYDRFRARRGALVVVESASGRV